ncbi:YbaY family lipoprotein [Shewanella abyssi]|uniref:YbaY family lipoprotein n=1 Tax=Shewanella abyssi TaxID=311789 RepID=UPI00200FDCAF|nr:YbaY family lipoprotein [Shewanella abyssi]MCL1051686.1 YbaY family lipoprotein [Shewanella abyssi]
MISVLKKWTVLLCLLTLNACVTVEEVPPVMVNGAAGYLEKLALPEGCSITIAIIDLDTPGVIVAQKSFNIVRAPVPFKFLLPDASIDDSIHYGVVAMIQYKGKVIFQTYDRFPVISNNKFTTEVVMKAVQAPRS